MEKKKISPEELASTLERIEDDTWYEAKERERLGKTQEPERVRLPRGQVAEYFRAKEAERGKGVPDFIKEWQEENKNYVVQNDDVSEAKIINETDVKFPVEFVDYLIDKARRSLREKDFHVFDEIETIKIRAISEKQGIIMAVRDKANALTFLDFYSVPPFDLKRVNSTEGVHTF